ncbi:MAG: hypothetical protein WC068_05430 [Caulobacter sp.]
MIATGQLPLQQFLVRVAHAIGAAAALSDDCQAHVGDLFDGAEARDGDHHRLQRLDLLSQTLHGLAHAVGEAAARAPATIMVDPAPILSGINLKALAASLTGTTLAEDHPAGECEMF